MLLRSLVSGMARDMAQQSLQQAVQQAGAEPRIDDAPCEVLVMFALSVESGGLFDMLDDPSTTKANSFVEYSGRLDGRRVVIVNSGVGREQAALATRNAVALHRPAWVISAGFAGGLVDSVRRGHIVLANQVIDPEGNQAEIRLAVDQDALALNDRLHSGRLVTVDEILATEVAKRSAAERFGAIACDMETSAVVRVCAGEKAKCFSVRIISDAVDDHLPPEVATLLLQKSWAGKIGAATGALFKRPSSALDMWQLKEDALKATDRLAKFLRSMIGQLPPME
jgi:adenosylhomocysteine nucleosidase